MKTTALTTRFVLATLVFCAATAPVMAQDPVRDGSRSSIEASAPQRQETEYKTSSGTVEVERERTSSGAVTTDVDHDWSAGTWLTIGLGLLLVLGLGYAMTHRRHDHFDAPVTGIR